MAGLSSTLFNIDVLREHNDRIFVFEGEIKTMYLAQMGFIGVGLSGKSQFQPDWEMYFHKAKEIVVCLDPDAEKQAIKIGLLLRRGNDNVKIMSLPVKPDDFFHIYNGTIDDFNSYVQKARGI